MAWAVREATRKATHVSMLTRSEKGLACACVCPACGGVLQAVNAGKSADEYLRDGAKRPFFRHHAGQQREACLQRVAQRAALELLTSHQELVLPAPTLRRNVVGASGDVYMGEATGRAYRAQIRSRQWVDEQTATLELDDGRIILVCLSGQALVSRDAGVDAVVTISIDDPLVSTWGPDEILARVRLEERWLCWESHWDEVDLAAEAIANARARAREALDLGPDDLVLPEGLTQLQRSESVLHAVIKQILSEAKSLRVPGFKSAVEKRTFSGRLISHPYGWSPVTLALTNVRLEKRLGVIVPDVMCEARDVAGKLPPAELLVEVAVTHPVDAAKTARIAQLGIACVEIDARLLAHGKKTIGLTELRQAVIGDPSNKHWIFHPYLEQLRIQTEAHVVREAASEDARTSAADARKQRLKATPVAEVLAEHLRLANLTLAQRPGTSEQPHDAVIRMNEALAELQTRQVRGLNNEALMTALRQVAAIRETAGRGFATPRQLVQESMHTYASKRWVTLLQAASSTYSAINGSGLNDGVDDIADRAFSDVAEGKLDFARTREFDETIRLAFPELGNFLDSAKGTVAQAESFRAMVRAQKEAQQAQEAEVAAARRTVESQKRREAERENRLQRLNAQFRWRNAGEGGIRTPDASKQLVKNLFPFESSVPRNGLIDQAWEARAQGILFAEFVMTSKYYEELGFDQIMVILKGAWVVTER